MELFDSPGAIEIIFFVCLGLVVVGSILFAAVVFRKMGDPKIENGVLGQATVLKIWETGLSVNNQPQVGFLLNVQHPNGSSYEAQTKAVISIVHLPQFQPGATVAVKIDANDPSRVALA